jgi:hypothetical protein
MLVIFHAGTVLTAPAISFSVDAMRFHIWHDAPCSANTFGGESSSLFSSVLGKLCRCRFPFGLVEFFRCTIRVSFNDALNKFAERRVPAEPGC